MFTKHLSGKRPSLGSDSRTRNAAEMRMCESHTVLNKILHFRPVYAQCPVYHIPCLILAAVVVMACVVCGLLVGLPLPSKHRAQVDVHFERQQRKMIRPVHEQIDRRLARNLTQSCSSPPRPEGRCLAFLADDRQLLVGRMRRVFQAELALLFPCVSAFRTLACTTA